MLGCEKFFNQKLIINNKYITKNIKEEINVRENEIKTNEDQELVPAMLSKALVNESIVAEPMVVIEPVIVAESTSVPKSIDVEPVVDAEPVIVVKNVETEPMTVIEPVISEHNLLVEPVIFETTVEAQPIVSEPIAVAEPVDADLAVDTEPVILKQIVVESAVAESIAVTEPASADPVVETKQVVPEPIEVVEPVIVVKNVETEPMAVIEAVISEPIVEPIAVAEPVDADLALEAEIVAPVVIQKDVIVASAVSEPVLVAKTLNAKSVLDIEPIVVAEPAHNITELNLLTESLIVDALLPEPISAELNNVEFKVTTPIPEEAIISTETNEDAKHLVDIIQTIAEVVEESSIEACRVVQTESVDRSQLMVSNPCVDESNSKFHIEILAAPQHSHTVIADNISFQTFSDESPPSLELNSADFLDDINVAAANALNFHVVSPIETKVSSSLKGEEHVAATKIQSTFRGFKARKSLNQTNEAKNGHPSNNDI